MKHRNRGVAQLGVVSFYGRQLNEEQTSGKRSFGDGLHFAASFVFEAMFLVEILRSKIQVVLNSSITQKEYQHRKMHLKLFSFGYTSVSIKILEFCETWCTPSLPRKFWEQ